jgi:hypothetical protein
VPEDPGARAMSPRIVLLGIPASVPHITKSYSKLSASLPSWVLALTTSKPASSYEAPLALGTLGTGTTTDCGEPRVTSARSPMLAINDILKGKHGGVIGHTAD